MKQAILIFGGGLKEKLYAAVRAGIKTILIPEENKKDLTEIDKQIIKNVSIKCVSEAKMILEHTLIKPIEPITINESQDIKALKNNISEEKIEKSIAH